MTVQASLAQQQQNIKNATVFSCTRLPDGEVDGTPAAVYSARGEVMGGAPGGPLLYVRNRRIKR